MKKYLEIRKFENDTVVKRMDVSSKSDKQIEKMEFGANMNLNHEEYYTEVVESENTLELI